LKKTLSIEKNPFSAKNQTLGSYGVYISPTKYQLLFKSLWVEKNCFFNPTTCCFCF